MSVKELYFFTLYNNMVLLYIRQNTMAKTPAEKKRAQRARDRAILGDKENKRFEAEKMKKWRASKRPPKPQKTTTTNNQPQPQAPFRSRSREC